MSDAERIFDVVLTGAVAFCVKRRLARQADRLEAARAVVEGVQRALLPSPPRRTGDFCAPSGTCRAWLPSPPRTPWPVRCRPM